MERLGCDSADCGFVHWNSPTPVVAALVVVNAQHVLARNTSWPEGVFSMLTGFLETAETPEHAVVREVQEELGLSVDSVEFIGHFPLKELNQLIIAYACHASGAARLGPEIAEIKALSDGELATHDFGPLRLTQQVVNQWFRMRPRS